MKLLKQYRAIFIVSLVLVFSSLIVALIGQKSEQYAAKSIVHVSNTIFDNWSKLNTHFGNPALAGETYRKVLLPEGKNIIDLMVQGSTVVVDKWQVEFENIGTKNITPMLHVHEDTQGLVTYVVGGSVLSGIDQNPEGRLGIFLSNVPFAVLKHIEALVDGTKDPHPLVDGSGQIQYAKHADDAQYELGIYASK